MFKKRIGFNYTFKEGIYLYVIRRQMKLVCTTECYIYYYYY